MGATRKHDVDLFDTAITEFVLDGAKLLFLQLFFSSNFLARILHHP